MKTDWNYTNLAEAYVNRPEYSPEALNQLFEVTQVKPQAHVCDVGAGVAHLTIPLLERGLYVDAVEPNDEMRRIGIQRTKAYEDVNWYEGTGEKTGMESEKYHLVTFGSSFNVTNRQEALKETTRILKQNGWFCCLWNHRNLEDEHQKSIESIIAENIEGYNYGLRREEQVDIINQSKLFKEVKYFEGNITHKVNKEDWINAWHSHATLERQAGTDFPKIVNKIETYVKEMDNSDEIIVPYVTRMWVAQKVS